MSVNKILLADKDVDYGKALATAISNLKNEFEISMTTLGSLKNERNAPKISFHEFDLILLSGYPKTTAESILKKTNKNTAVAILTEDITDSLAKQFENETNHIWYIYKYSNLNDIVSDLHYLAGSVVGKKSFARKSFAPVLVGLFSISGGTGKTSTAIGISRELSRYHDKKVLYLSYEEMPATELFFGNHPQNRNIGDYLYYLFEKKNDDICSRPGGFTSADHYGVETFYPTMGRNDLNDLTQQETIHFLKVLSDSCRYDYIILDLKNELSEGTLFLMNLCEKVIVIQNDEPVSYFKTRKSIAYLEQAGLSEMRERIILTVNRSSANVYEKEDLQDMIFNGIKRFYIEEDENSFCCRSDHMEIDISHAFGLGIKKIADSLLLQTKEEG